MPPLELFPLPLSFGERTVTDCSRVTRPSLFCIDTEAASCPDLHTVNMSRAMGHRHSRSLEATPRTTPISASTTLTSASSDTFLLPWSRETTPSHLPGVYISQSRRKNFSVATGNTFVPPLVPALPSLDAIDVQTSPKIDFYEDSVASEEDINPEGIWDLIPYDISWGSTYYGYEEGTLPGPDGKCIFLRSPIPIKYQRTNQACEKCRERKAKCSGTRPSCTRCTTRGLTCEYAPDSKRSKPEDIADESEIFGGIVDLRHAQSSSETCTSPPGAGRIRRNTECCSHGAQSKAQGGTATLRRRHSTIGLPVSAPLFSRGRIPRLARRTIRNSAGLGFLGVSQDALITSSDDVVEDDELSVSESNRLSNQHPHRDTDLFLAQGPFATSAVVHGPHGHQLPNKGWDVDIHDNTMHEQNTAEFRALPAQCTTDHDTYIDFFLSPPSTLEQSNVLDEFGYNLQMRVDESAGSELLTTSSGKDIQEELDYCAYDAVPLEALGYGEIKAPKFDMTQFGLGMALPQVAVPSHAPDFHYFNRDIQDMSIAQESFLNTFSPK